MDISVIPLLVEEDAAIVGGSVRCGASTRAFQGKVVGTGALTAQFKIQASLDNVVFEDLGTITLSGNDSVHDGLSMIQPWPYVRGELVSITGTDALASLNMGVAS